MSEAEDARRVAVLAARAGGQVIRGALAAGPRRVQHKGATDLVTEVDLAAEAAIRELLHRESPGTVVLAEESALADTAGAPARWIVDPLDGTTNFVHGFPAFGVSVALERDGELLGACVYEPLLDRCTAAGRGLGTTQDGMPVRVSDCVELDRALMLTGFAYDRRIMAPTYLRFVQAFLERAQGLRRAGAAALDFCHIAAGRADGYWEFNLSPWDVAAGILLVQEAGGRVSTPGGGPVKLDQPQIVATNGHIHDAVLATMAPLLRPEGAPAAPGSGRD
jgi:myo-inositol-1(or 4)-monophosphatase